MDKVKAGTTSYVAATFKDGSGVLQTPNSVSCEILCLTTGEVVRAAANITTPMASSVSIPITAAENALQDPNSIFEIKRAIITASYGASDAIVETYDWRIDNPAYAPSSELQGP